ncbi:MAG: formylglycine-generating enzyme family protein [Isosphaeraceae bacterium]
MCDGAKRVVFFIAIKQSFSPTADAINVTDSPCPSEVVALLEHPIDYRPLADHTETEFVTAPALPANSKALTDAVRGSLQKARAGTGSVSSRIIKQNLQVFGTSLVKADYLHENRMFAFWMVGNRRRVYALPSPITEFANSLLGQAVYLWAEKRRFAAAFRLSRVLEMGQADLCCLAVLDSGPPVPTALRLLAQRKHLSGIAETTKWVSLLLGMLVPALVALFGFPLLQELALPIPFFGRDPTALFLFIVLPLSILMGYDLLAFWYREENAEERYASAMASGKGTSPTAGRRLPHLVFTLAVLCSCLFGVTKLALAPERTRSFVSDRATLQASGQTEAAGAQKSVSSPERGRGSVTGEQPDRLGERVAIASSPKTPGLTSSPTTLPVTAPQSITNSIGMELVRIEPGEFLMGSPDSDLYAKADEKPPHRMRITRPFYLGKYEVTVGQFRRFVDDSGYQTEAEKDGKGGYGLNEAANRFEQAPRYTWREAGFEQTDLHPVVNVSWNDAVAFAEWLGKKEGKTYRLPTEAEWEYACRAGTTTRYWSGDDAETLAAVANVADGTAKAKFPQWETISGFDGFVYTAPVGKFRANAFGMYDMHGNVWEWCWDWYSADYYKEPPVDDPRGPSQASDRVVRGGSWYDDPRFVRSANRLWDAPGIRSGNLGFRVARPERPGGVEIASPGTDSSSKTDAFSPIAPPASASQPVAPSPREAADVPATKTVIPSRELTSPSTGMVLVRIEPGEFLMGSPDSDKDARADEKPPHRVRITRPFYLGKYEVTQAEYEAVMGQNPSGFQGNASPVERVSWLDAVRFCNQLSEREGLKPFYGISGEAVRVPDWNGTGYRLPTEAEWEYACRAGTPMMRYSFGDDEASLGEFSWFGGNSGSGTHEVGQKRANDIGLHDMHGNVWEWCWDWYSADYYKEPPVDDPRGPSRGSGRVIRGGSWDLYPRSCRSANRDGGTPVSRNVSLGFRLARVQPGG